MPTAQAIEPQRSRAFPAATPILVALLLAYAATRWIAVPAGVTELDEVLFCFGVDTFDVRLHHPHPPGYPVYVALGKLVAAATGLSPFRAFTAIGLFASCLAAIPLYRLARSLASLGRFESVLVVALYGFSPVVWLNSARALSDVPAAALCIWIAYLLGSLIAPPRVRAPATRYVFAAAVAALTIGVRPQAAVMLVPMLVFVAWRLRLSVRIVLLALGASIIVCVAWLAPMIALSGGWRAFWSVMAEQRHWYMRYDTLFGTATAEPWIDRVWFWSHPWGLMATSLPILLAAVAGVIRLSLRRSGAGAFLLVWLLPFALFLVLAHSPATPRYALPVLAPIALAAVAGLSVAPRLGRLVGVLLVAGLVAQGGGWVWRHHREAIPPVQAADWLVQRVQADGGDDRVLIDAAFEVLLSRHPLFRGCEVVRDPQDITPAVDGRTAWYLTARPLPDRTPAFSAEWKGLRLRRFTRNRYKSGYVYPIIGTEP